MKFGIKVFLLFSAVIAVMSLNYSNLLPHDHVNQQIISAIRVILSKALHRKYPLIHTISTVHDERDGYLCDLKSDVVKMLSENYSVRIDSNKYSRNSQNRLRQNSIFFIDDIRSFHIISNNLSTEKYRFNGNFLFILIYGYFEELREIFNTMWIKNIYNVYALYEVADDIVLNTFLPYESQLKCGDITPTIIARFNNDKFNDEEELFKNKLKNLHECPVRIATYEDNGCLMVRKFPNGSKELHGYRMDFMNVLSKSLNYTNEIKIIEGNEPWGVVYSNGSATGTFHEILENKSDIAFSEYYLKTSRNNFFDNSMPFYSTPLVFIIPPGQRFTPFEKLLQPFDIFIWIILSITIIFSLFVILLINNKFKSLQSFVYGFKVYHPVTNMFIALIGTQQTVLPRKNFARFILMMFIILTLVLRSIYQGSLYQFLQSDGRHKEVQSINEMIDRDFKFYMYESQLDLIQYQTEILKRTEIFNGINFLLTNQLNGGENFAGLEALSDVHAANKNYDFIHKVCKEPLMTMNLVIYFRKSFHLINEINKVIQALISSGIIDYWLRRSFDEYKELKNCHPRKLNIDDLTGPFNVLIIGCTISSVLFLIEFIYIRIKLNINLKIVLN